MEDFFILVEGCEYKIQAAPNKNALLQIVPVNSRETVFEWNYETDILNSSSDNETEENELLIKIKREIENYFLQCRNAIWAIL